MTGRDDDPIDSGADWFAAQFGAGDEEDAPPVTPAAPAAPVPPQTPPPAAPPRSGPPAVPPTLINPFGSAPGSPPVSPPPPPVTPPPAARPHAAVPPAQVPPAQVPPTQVPPAPAPPAAGIPGAPGVPPTTPPAQPSGQPPASPATPPAAAPAAAGGFNWGLRPSGGDAPPAPPSQPPAPFPATPPSPPAPPSQPAAPFPPSPPSQQVPPTPPPAVPHSAAPPAFAGPPPTEPFAPDLRPPTPFVESEPTQPFTPDFDDMATQAYAPPVDDMSGAASAVPPTERLPAADQPTALFPSAEAESGDALQSLFGEDQFREVPVGPDPNEAPFAKRLSKSSRDAGADGGDGGGPGDGDGPPVAGFGKTQKVLMAVAGGLIGILALIVLYFVGTRLPDLLGPAPVITASPAPSASATVDAIGPVEPGLYLWDELLGGECLDPYTDAWQTQYTVVDCDEPHAAQLVYRGSYQPEPEESDDETPATAEPLVPFPGVEELQAGIDELCAAQGVVNLEGLNNLLDVTMQGSYPATAEQWEKDPSYRCFVTRTSGEPLEGSAAYPVVASDEG